MKNYSSKLKEKIYEFCIIGVLCIFFEICYYTLVKIFKYVPFIGGFISYAWGIDPLLDLNAIWETPLISLFGQTSLWMFFVYGFAAVFVYNPIRTRIKTFKWPIRGLFYCLGITFVDIVTGLILKIITGYDIWYNLPQMFPLFKYSSVAILPVWFLIGLISERFYPKIINVSIFLSNYHNIEKKKLYDIDQADIFDSQKRVG